MIVICLSTLGNKCYNADERVMEMSTLSDLEKQRIDITHIASKHGAKKISIFGSTVRGEDTPSSDIDFLVDFEDGRTLFDLIRLKLELESLLCRSIDIVSSNYLHWKMKDQIMNEAVQL